MGKYKRDYYLVDTENVRTGWVCCLPELKTRDKVILFTSENSSTFTFSAEDLIKVSKIPVLEEVKCYCGTPDALDFQLCSYLGFLIAGASKTTYHIISNDHGFDNAIKFWCDKGINVSRMDAPQSATKTKPPVASPPESPLELVKKENASVSPVKPTQTLPKKDESLDFFIKPDAEALVKKLIKQKYRTDRNVKVLYKAMLSGEPQKLKKVIREIADDLGDIEKMERTLTAHILKLQKMA